MLDTTLDLPAALDYCHQLITRVRPGRLQRGVFMENQNSSFGLHTKWLSNTNLLYPCNTKDVERKDKLYCYLLVTSHILPYVGGDRVKTADWCRTASPPGSTTASSPMAATSQAKQSGTRTQMKNFCDMAGSGEGRASTARSAT